ncbi:MAG: hypothetical protein HYV08_17205 [Deltaproteobacteria bacterium]|nr:hypothetical protein [Deltaproteobacteria bacterium]MBI3078645.1 hypothetical protein [Deltaproteobacteria bacterium]
MMRTLLYIALALSVIGLILAGISHLASTSILGATARGIARATTVMLLFGVNFGLLELLQARK